jgi:putative MFS transporter
VQASANGGNSAAAIAARLDRLPSSRYLWRLVLLLAAGAYFEIYDLLMTGYVSPGIIKAGIFSEHGLFGLSDQAAFASVTFAGLTVGALIFGRIADSFGRRAVFTSALLWYAAATAIMATQSSIAGIFLMRFLAGIGLGVEMITIDTFMAELVPRKFRGRAFAATHGLMFLSVPTVAFLSWALLDAAPLGISGWRWVAAFPALGALVIWWIRRELPESPRWLAQHGRFDEAAAIAARIEARIERETGKPLPPPEPVAAHILSATGHGTFADMFRPPYRRRTIMLCVFNFCQTIGFYGFGNWVPKLVSGQGVDIRDSLLYASLIALAYPVGPFLFMLFADRFERKWQIVVAALGTAAFGLLFTLQREAWSIIMLGILINFSANLMSYSYHAYQAELFPTSIRSRAVGFTYAFSRLSTIFTSFLIAFFSREFGNPGVFTFIALSMVVAAGSIGLFGPRTNGRTLEDINRE